MSSSLRTVLGVSFEPLLRPGFLDPFEGNEVTWARGRLYDRIYVSHSFTLDMRNSQDHGEAARYVTKVFDEVASEASSQWPREEWVVMTTPGGRKQLKLQVAKESGRVREIVLQKVPTDPASAKLETLPTLDRDASARLIDLVKALEYIPVEGEKSVRVDDRLVRDLFADPTAMEVLYGKDPERFRELIRADASAEDVIAVAHRRDVVRRFRRLLEDPESFAAVAAGFGGRKEAVWQDLLEQEPWVLGATLAGQLLTSWDASKLEQVVVGYSIAGAGKRADALLRTNGRIRSMIFAEIKHHETPLLAGTATPYRPDCWAPSAEVTGGVVQVQQTVHRAAREIGGRLPDEDDSGVETGEHTYLVRPRSFLIVGDLEQLRGDAGVHRAKWESFELYRRNLHEPEIITFDEVLARAEWQATLLDGEL